MVSLRPLLERRRADDERRIVAALDPIVWRYGLDVMRAVRMRSGRFYPILGRLEDTGVIEAKWADLEPGKRFRRRLYRLTDLYQLAGEGVVVEADGGDPHALDTPTPPGGVLRVIVHPHDT